MMTATERGFATYQTYNSICLHFDPKANYDAFAYRFKTNTKFETYERKPERIFFELVSKHYDPKSFIAYNRAEHGWVSIKNLARDKVYKTTHDDYAKQIQSFGYFLPDILKQLPKDKRTLFEVKNGQHPPIVKLYLGKQLTLLDMVLIDRLYGFVDYLDKNIQERVYWPDKSFLIKKLSPFVAVDVPNLLPKFESHFA